MISSKTVYVILGLSTGWMLSDGLMVTTEQHLKEAYNVLCTITDISWWYIMHNIMSRKLVDNAKEYSPLARGGGGIHHPTGREGDGGYHPTVLGTNHMLPVTC